MPSLACCILPPLIIEPVSTVLRLTQICRQVNEDMTDLEFSVQQQDFLFEYIASCIISILHCKICIQIACTVYEYQISQANCQY